MLWVLPTTCFPYLYYNSSTSLQQHLSTWRSLDSVAQATSTPVTDTVSPSDVERVTLPPGLSGLGAHVPDVEER